MIDVEIGNGRYRLIRRIGEGGTGCVYQAVDLVLGRTVAIKALHNRHAVDLLRDEGRSLACLNHPHVVGIHDLLEGEGGAFLVMEYVDGRSLDRWLVEQGPLRLGPALEMFRQVAEAVAQAHRQGIVHCDLKPANVLVSTSGEVKLTDFTLAHRLIDGRFDGPGGGSARYAAPEQLNGAAVGPQADIYGLGALLRDMVYFVDMASPEGQQVRAAVERATAPDPADRFAGVEDLLAALPLPDAGATRLAPLSPLPSLTRVAPAGRRPATAATRWPLGALCAALVLCGAALFTHFPVAASPARVTVPDLVAAQSQSAQLVAHSLALQVRSVWVYSAAAPNGTVIAQQPAPGSRIETEGVVTLIVSKGPKPVAVPELRGLKQEAAAATLKRLGFRIALRKEDTITHSPGEILNQSPLPDTRRVPGTTITLTVSQKPWWWIF